MSRERDFNSLADLYRSVYEDADDASDEHDCTNCGEECNCGNWCGQPASCCCTGCGCEPSEEDSPEDDVDTNDEDS